MQQIDLNDFQAFTQNNESVLRRFPRLSQFIQEEWNSLSGASSAEESCSAGMLLLNSIGEFGHLRHPFSKLHLLEFFLENSANLPAGMKKMSQMLRGPVQTENDAIVQERSFLAEATASRILVEKLHLRISGFDERSPQRTRGDCDIVTGHGERTLFFEVKAKSSQQKHQTEEGFNVDSNEDIAAWLFKPDSFGRKQERKLPKIEEAGIKGADYLMALVPQWKECDSTMSPMLRFIRERIVCEQIGEYSFASEDDQLGSEVAGLILFAPLGDYFVIENLNVSRHVARISA